jgi:hypothetical protein
MEKYSESSRVVERGSLRKMVLLSWSAGAVGAGASGPQVEPFGWGGLGCSENRWARSRSAVGTPPEVKSAYVRGTEAFAPPEKCLAWPTGCVATLNFT